MPEAKADPRARLICDRAELKYNFGAQHPLQPDRLVALIGVPNSKWTGSNVKGIKRFVKRMQAIK